MKHPIHSSRGQRGVFMIEALVAILVFTIGMLGMLGLAARGMSAQADARYRNEAANYANELASVIALGVDRSALAVSPTSIQNSLPAFQHQPSPAPPNTGCSFTGTATTNAGVQAVLDRMVAAGSGLPGATAAGQQIHVDASNAGFNRVTITLCWKAADDVVSRRHTFVTYIN